jgi:hypothetical protein
VDGAEALAGCAGLAAGLRAPAASRRDAALLGPGAECVARMVPGEFCSDICGQP